MPRYHKICQDTTRFAKISQDTTRYTMIKHDKISHSYKRHCYIGNTLKSMSSTNISKFNVHWSYVRHWIYTLLNTYKPLSPQCIQIFSSLYVSAALNGFCSYTYYGCFCKIQQYGLMPKLGVAGIVFIIMPGQRFSSIWLCQKINGISLKLIHLISIACAVR